MPVAVDLLLVQIIAAFYVCENKNGIAKISTA